MSKQNSEFTEQSFNSSNDSQNNIQKNSYSCLNKRPSELKLEVKRVSFSPELRQTRSFIPQELEERKDADNPSLRESLNEFMDSDENESSWESVETKQFTIDSSNVQLEFGKNQFEGISPDVLHRVAMNKSLFKNVFENSLQKEFSEKPTQPMTQIDHTWYKSQLEPNVGTSLFLQIDLGAKTPDLTQLPKSKEKSNGTSPEAFQIKASESHIEVSANDSSKLEQKSEQSKKKSSQDSSSDNSSRDSESDDQVFDLLEQNKNEPREAVLERKKSIQSLIPLQDQTTKVRVIGKSSDFYVSLKCKHLKSSQNVTPIEEYTKIKPNPITYLGKRTRYEQKNKKISNITVKPEQNGDPEISDGEVIIDTNLTHIIGNITSFKEE